VFATDDTIVAIATPQARGALGIVRISGPLTQHIAAAIITRRSPLEPRRATFTRIRLRDSAASAGRGLGSAPPAGHVRGADEGRAVDDVVVTSFPAPHSYTGEHVVEISAHGSPVVLRAIVRAAIDEGARLAQPGEFTLRAFLNGKVDLIQAEAVADLIAAATPLQLRVAFDQLEGTLTRRIADIDAVLFDLIARLEASLDFPDEGYHFIAPTEIAARIGDVVQEMDCLLADAERGRMIREGATLVIAGRPNVGKSSVFNRLAGTDRAIVTPIPGTTRDLITETVDIEGLAVALVDTAGLHDADDVVEREGISRATHAREVADLVLVVLDRSQPLTAADRSLIEHTSGMHRIVVANKSDLPQAAGFDASDALCVSAATGEGLDDLRRAIGRSLTGDEVERDTAALSNVRHVSLLRDAREALVHARDASTLATPEEFLLSDLQAARARFDDIVGARTSDDVLRHIFERFCVGK
jgi:tRNA modification GTPase